MNKKTYTTVLCLIFAFVSSTSFSMEVPYLFHYLKIKLSPVAIIVRDGEREKEIKTEKPEKASIAITGEQVLDYVRGVITGVITTPEVKSCLIAEKDYRVVSKFIYQTYGSFLYKHKQKEFQEVLFDIFKDPRAMQFLIINALEEIILIPENPRIKDIEWNAPVAKTKVEKGILKIAKKEPELHLKKGFLH